VADEFDDTTLDDDEDEATHQVAVPRSEIRKLERKAREAERERAERERAERELAVFRAGLGELSEAQRRALLAVATDTTPEALRATAESLGFLRAPEPVAEPAAVPEPADRTAEARALAEAAAKLADAGAVPDDGSDPDPYLSALRAHREALAVGRDTDALAAAVSVIRQAGMRGDTRVIYNPANPRQWYPTYDPT
jgi:hypothetical protein